MAISSKWQFLQKIVALSASLKTSPPFSEEASEKILTSHYCSSLSPVYFYLQQLIQLFPVVTYLSSACFWAISIQRVYKVTALMDFRKEVVFFSARVGGGSEASCLSSFNWFSVAIGASRFFFLPWKCSTSEHTAWIQIYKKFVRGVVQDFTLIIAYIRWLAAHFGGNVWFRRSLLWQERFMMWI